jgi:hypothetical protein
MLIIFILSLFTSQGQRGGWQRLPDVPPGTVGPMWGAPLPYADMTAFVGFNV